MNLGGEPPEGSVPGGVRVVIVPSPRNSRGPRWHRGWGRHDILGSKSTLALAVVQGPETWARPVIVDRVVMDIPAALVSHNRVRKIPYRVVRALATACELDTDTDHARVDRSP